MKPYPIHLRHCAPHFCYRFYVKKLEALQGKRLYVVRICYLLIHGKHIFHNRKQSDKQSPNAAFCKIYVFVKITDFLNYLFVCLFVCLFVFFYLELFYLYVSIFLLISFRSTLITEIIILYLILFIVSCSLYFFLIFHILISVTIKLLNSLDDIFLRMKIICNLYWFI